MKKPEIGKLIALKIELALKEQKMKKKELAKLMNVKQPSISRWFRGNHNFTIETIFKIEQILNITIINLD